jgi:ABC-type uncharacterized transport system involved in gliding motility auxiliary subunit
MKPGLKALAIALLFTGLVLVNYLAAHLPLRLDATAEKIYTLSPGTRALLAKIGDPITVDLYFSKDAEGLPILYKDYADRVQAMLRQYVRAAGGKLTLNVINPKADTPEEEKAQAAGLEAHNDPESGAEPIYFGLAATQADQRAALPQLTPEREQFLEYDLSQLVYTVQQADKKKLGLLTTLPLQGVPFDMMSGRSVPGQVVAKEWERTYTLETVAPDADTIPATLDALAIIHPPQELAPKTQYAIDQFILSGKPVFLALDPSSQYFKHQGSQMSMMGGPPPGVSSDLPVLLKAYGVDYNSQNIVGDPAHATKVRTSRSGGATDMPTWLSLDRDSVNPNSQVTAQLKSFLFVEAGSFSVQPGVNMTPLIQTSDRSGVLVSSSLMFASPEDISRQLTPLGKMTIAGLVQGKFKTAFPDGAPAATPPADGDKKPDAPAAKTPGLTESKTSSTLLIVTDTDWLFDDYIFDPDYRQQGILAPRNDNLAFAANALDYLSGSSDLLSIRGKGASLRPFKVVMDMEETARKKYDQQLTALEAQLNEVQTKLGELQTKKTEGGRLVATPEVQKAIEDFRKQQLVLKTQQREIRRTLREDIDALGRRLLWINVLATPLLVGAFGLWFQRARKK